MAATGTVRTWDAEAGWGIIDSASAPGGCRVSWTALPGAGWRYLRAGQTVTFDAESADQDGFAFRATRVWNVEVHGAAAAGQPDVAAPETKSTESTSSAWDIGSDGTVTEVE